MKRVLLNALNSRETKNWCMLIFVELIGKGSTVAELEEQVYQDHTLLVEYLDLNSHTQKHSNFGEKSYQRKEKCGCKHYFSSTT